MRDAAGAYFVGLRDPGFEDYISDMGWERFARVTITTSTIAAAFGTAIGFLSWASQFVHFPR